MSVETAALDAAVARIVARFEALAPGDLDRLHELYTEDARFKDPFNEVQGVAAIRRIFEHMFATLDDPRFVVTQVVAQHGQCHLGWDFHFRLRRFNRAGQTIRGASYLQLAPDGRIALHRDYWDAAEELYEKLPLVGSLMRWLKRRARA
ncbi:MAG: nuclear transport factor 2 family protein [Burkholderiales bacterium]|nr:nuclear transport factor 2 family protein [Burkholderiales bacterium]